MLEAHFAEFILFCLPVVLQLDWLLLALGFCFDCDQGAFKRFSVGEQIACVSFVPLFLQSYGSTTCHHFAVVPIVLSSIKNDVARLSILVAAKSLSGGIKVPLAILMAVVELYVWNLLVDKGKKVVTILEAAISSQMASAFLELAFGHLHQGIHFEEIKFIGVCVLATYLLLRVVHAEGFKFWLFVIGLVSFCGFSFPGRLWWLLSRPHATELIAYWTTLLCVSLPLIHNSKMHVVILRKMFHLVCFLIFLPPMLAAPLSLPFVAAAAFSVFCAFIAIEAVRVSDLSVGRIIKESFGVYMDSKQEESMVVSHVGLLVGCVLPLWASLIMGYSEDADLYSGIILVAVGDAAAAVVGVLTTRVHRLPGSRRSMEGLAAFVVTATLTSWLCGMRVSLNRLLLAGLLENYTESIDNIVLPMYFRILA